MHWIYQSSLTSTPDLFGVGFPFAFALLPILVWMILWKGWALWLAARRDDFGWFVVLLIVNTLGLLEIFYIFVIAERKDKREEEKNGAHNNVKEETLKEKVEGGS